MNAYTVVLLRPEYMTEESGEEFGMDTYVAMVTEESLEDAIKTAQKKVMASDKRDGLRPRNAEDYKMCLIFPGHIHPELYGWQV